MLRLTVEVYPSIPFKNGKTEISLLRGADSGLEAEKYFPSPSPLWSLRVVRDSLHTRIIPNQGVTPLLGPELEELPDESGLEAIWDVRGERMAGRRNNGLV